MIYTIKQGNHYCWPRWPSLYLSKGKELVEVTFNKSNLYQLGNDNQQDVNKLHGRTFGLDVHHNSYRIGWRPTDKYIDLFHYSYVNGQRLIKIFDIVHINQKVIIPIDYNHSSGYIKVGNELTNFNTANMPHWGLRCFPYVGGDEAAIHQMKLSLKIK